MLSSSDFGKIYFIFTQKKVHKSRDWIETIRQSNLVYGVHPKKNLQHSIVINKSLQFSNQISFWISSKSPLIL